MEFDCKIGGVKYTGIELLDVQISLPTVKTQQESIPGADGVIDLTDVLGSEPAYGNRAVKLRFGSIRQEASTSMLLRVRCMASA